MAKRKPDPLDHLLKRPWEVSTTADMPGVSVALDVTGMAKEEITQAKTLLESYGVDINLHKKQLIVKCAGPGANPENLAIMTALFADVLGQQSGLLTRLVDTVNDYDAQAASNIRPAKKTISVKEAIKALEEPPNYARKFPKTAEFLEHYSPRISVIPARGTRPGFVTLRIPLDATHTVAGVNSLLPHLYRELHVGEVAPIANPNARHTLQDIMDELTGERHSARRSFPANRGPYTYETRDDSTYVVCFPTPLMHPKGAADGENIFTHLCDALKLDLMDRPRIRPPGYTQGTLGF